MSAIALTNDTFQQTIGEEKRTILVDFYADWCGPCKAFAPALDELATKRGDALIAKLNIEDAPQIAREFGVRSVPTLIVFKNGEVANRYVGVPTQQELDTLLN